MDSPELVDGSKEKVLLEHFKFIFCRFTDFFLPIHNQLIPHPPDINNLKAFIGFKFLAEFGDKHIKGAAGIIAFIAPNSMQDHLPFDGNVGGSMQ